MTDHPDHPLPYLALEGIDIERGRRECSESDDHDDRVSQRVVTAKKKGDQPGRSGGRSRRRSGAKSALYSSKRHDWRTPPYVLELVRQLGPIGLDPCTGPGSIVGAAVEWDRDGLDQSWTGHGLVYVNPPYGRALDAWVTKAAWEGAVARTTGDEILLLVTSRTDTARFHDVLRRADAVCFWRGRISFRRPDGSTGAGAAFPSLLAYWGRRKHRFADVFERMGWVVVPRV